MAIENTSFIVIAKNAEYAVDLCLKSILSMPLNNCEIICIDSSSRDGTFSVMAKYKKISSSIRIFKCRGYSNASIARNIGLNHATKKYIFFVDGDVELETNFIYKALEILHDNKAEIVTGQLKEIYYSNDFKRQIKKVKDRFDIQKEKKIFLCGGCFIVHNALIRQVGYWNEQMIRNQDIDYSLRLSRKGKMIAIPLPMGTHHTLLHLERAVIYLKSRYPIYLGMILRENRDRPIAILELLRRQKGLLYGFIFWGILIIGIFMELLFSDYLLYSLIIASLIIVIDIIMGILTKKVLLNRLVYHYLHILYVIRGIFKGKINANCHDSIVEEIL